MTTRLKVATWRDPVLVAAVVLPLVVLLGVVALRPSDPSPAPTPPDSAPLDRLAVACPAPLNAPAGPVRITRTSGLGTGRVQVRVEGKGNRGLERREGRPAGPGVTAVPNSKASTVVTGTGGAAPGLALGRDERGSLPECGEPWYDDWFLGAGAAARQSTVIELVNPDPSTAVVNIELYGPGGPIEDASWRGIAVAGHRVMRVDLAERPARPLMAAQVTVDQGRIRAFARHTFDSLGRGPSSREYLPAQREPSEQNLLLALPTRGAQRSLMLANPGDDEARATVRVVTTEATLRPTGVEEIPIPPRSQRRVPLVDVLGDAGGEALGIVVDATEPVVASTWGLVEDDLVTAGAVTAYDEPMAAVLPRGAKTLVAGGATGTGTVRVTATAPDGRRVWDDKPFEISADRAVTIDLPDRAVRIEVRGRGTSIAGAVRVTDAAGSAVVRLRPSPTRSLVPAVEPAR